MCATLSCGLLGGLLYLRMLLKYTSFDPSVFRFRVGGRGVIVASVPVSGLSFKQLRWTISTCFAYTIPVVYNLKSTESIRCLTALPDIHDRPGTEHLANCSEHT